MRGMVCPQCQGSMPGAGEAFVCKGCLKQWRIKDGIYVFGEDAIAPSEIVEDHELKELLANSELNGWQVAFYEYSKARIRQRVMVPEDRRIADWLYLLPLNQQTVALLIGCGWGTLPMSLSELCRAVYTVDPVWERVQYINILKTQRNVRNLFPFYTRGRFDLPFSLGSFDLVVMSGGCEWRQDTQDGHRLDFELALRKIHGLLKQPGSLVLIVGNRFSFRRLLQAQLERFNVRREGLLWTEHSLPGYKKLLQAIGFPDIEFYAPLPGHTAIPLFYLPLDSERAMSYFLRYLFPLFEAVSPEVKRVYVFQYSLAKIAAELALLFGITRLTKLLVPGFIIIASKA